MLIYLTRREIHEIRNLLTADGEPVTQRTPPGTIVKLTPLPEDKRYQPGPCPELDELIEEMENATHARKTQHT